MKNILKKLVNGDRAAWEDELGTAFDCLPYKYFTVTGHSPFMLRYVHPPRYPLTGLLNDDPARTFQNRLEQQSELLQHVARATAESRMHNRRRLAQQANADELNVGDRVILKAREPLSLTAKWDFNFVVTKS